MSHRTEDGKVLIQAEPDGKCELCGIIEETRPYGPNGKQICYSCGQKDIEQTEAQMGYRLFGDPLPEKYQ